MLMEVCIWVDKSSFLFIKKNQTKDQNGRRYIK